MADFRVSSTSPVVQKENFKINQDSKPKLNQQKLESPAEAPKVNKKADFDRAKAEVLGAAPDAGKATRNETTSTVNALVDETAKSKNSAPVVVNTKGSSDTVAAKKDSGIDKETKLFQPVGENLGDASKVEKQKQDEKTNNSISNAASIALSNSAALAQAQANLA